MESKRQRNIRHALEEFYPGSFWFKAHGGPYQAAGLPDLIGCVKGLYCGFEVKEPGKPPASILQKATVQLIIDAGGCGLIGVTTVAECIKAIEGASWPSFKS